MCLEADKTQTKDKSFCKKPRATLFQCQKMIRTFFSKLPFFVDCIIMAFASYIASIIISVSVFFFHVERILKQLEEEQQSRKSAEEKFKELEGRCK